MFPGYVSKFLKTDPEFIERFDNFAFDEVVNSDDLDDRARMMAILAALLGCQGLDEFKAMLPAALNFGVTPVEAKEIVYQAVAYLGIGRVFPFLRATNDVLTARGVELPLPVQATTTTENRLTAGIQAQVDIFGESMKGFWKSGPEESRPEGRSWYQAWGEEPQELHPGDVVNIPPEVKHWHGAAKDSWFAHLAVEIPAEGATNEWLEPVDDEAYDKLK